MTSVGPKKILIVDDEPKSVVLLKRLLLQQYQTMGATDGHTALDLARQLHPDLILLDVMMPGLDGFEVCRALKANSETANIPVIFLTTLAEAETIATGFTLGAVDYIVKPCNAIELNARVNTHLQLQEAKEELVQKNAELREQAELLELEVAERRTAQKLLKSQQQLLESQNTDLEERLAVKVKKCRDKDQALMQNEKMASIGLLAAGVAHEINSPLGFISCNLRVLTNYFDQIVRFDRFRRDLDDSDSSSANLDAVATRRVERDIDYILEDGADLIRGTLDGTSRLTKIVQDLKLFARVDFPEKEAIMLDHCLESALSLCNSELKYVATIRKECEPLPKVLCNRGQLSQVFLNLLVNAGQAIVSETPGEIVLRSWQDGLFVYVSVSDTGKGIPEEIRGRIFDPFFTTKDVGKGTGLGLSISSGIIKKHNGELLVESVVGVGTTFTVKLPRTQDAE